MFLNLSLDGGQWTASRIGLFNHGFPVTVR